MIVVSHRGPYRFEPRGDGSFSTHRSAGGVGESVRHEQTGLLVDSAAELERAVERLVTEPELRHRLSQAGREWALSFDWDETASAVEALVERLADGQVAGLP